MICTTFSIFFKSEFSRTRSWLLFCGILLSFLAAPEMIGVTSICRYWLSDDRGYSRLLHFFRADAYDLGGLRHCWHRFVLSHYPLVKYANRLVVLVDHSYVVKDGRRMPGVVSQRQLSETQSKPSYFRGQCWGAAGLLVGSFSACFCLPLTLQIHQGFQHLGEVDSDDSLTERAVRMALDFAVRNDRMAWLVLDAYFSVAPVFRLATSVWSVKDKQPYLQIVTRAKKNYVAYFPPPPPTGKPGRPRTYGDKMVLWETFDHSDLFYTVEMDIYGHKDTVQLMVSDLLWRPLGDYVRFVWAITSRGPIVLMCSDLTATPEQVLALYCRRIRIETLFDTLKNKMGAFNFHFWSRYLPRHSRQAKSNKQLKTPLSEHVDKVIACWRAMETFVFCASVATGILQLFSLRYHESLWKQQVLYLRTRSRELPSENTVRQILAPLLARHLWQSRQNTLLQEIRQALEGEEEPDKSLFG
ncbi:MAG: transposase [Thiolinea sp.]